MILRDHLAYERTVLANERTLMAYLRTATTCVIIAITFLKYLPELVPLAWSLIALGIATLFFGSWRFLKVRNKMKLVQQSPVSSS